MTTALPHLPAACPGELGYLETGAGRIAVYRAGTGGAPPLLLVHSMNAVASAFEVRPVYGHFAQSRTVYALDLPGFGLSERSERVYSARLMTDAVLAVTAHIGQAHGGVAVDALALSTGCEFLARAAAERPPAFRSLALVSPTGFRGTRPVEGAPGSSRGIGWLHRAMSSRLLGDALFDNLTRPGVIRYFLEKTWGSKGIDEDLWRYSCLTARVPGAKHAPLYFVSACLFSADIFAVYRSLTQPVWMSHGVRGDFTDYRLKGRFDDRPNWRFTVYPSGALPYFEEPARFVADYESFLAQNQDIK